MKTSKKMDIGKTLLIGAAAFQAYQFGRGMYVYDPHGWHVQGVSLNGLALGVIVNVVIAIAATRLPGLKGKARTQSAWIGFIGLALLSPALVAPAMYLLFKDLPLWFGLKVFLSIGVSIAPDLAIGLGGFVAGKSLVYLHSDDERPQSEEKPSAQIRTAKKSKPHAVVACRYAGAGCEMSGSQNAMNAHARHCRFKPTIEMDQSLLFDKSKVGRKP